MKSLAWLPDKDGFRLWIERSPTITCLVTRDQNIGVRDSIGCNHRLVNEDTRVRGKIRMEYDLNQSAVVDVESLTTEIENC